MNPAIPFGGLRAAAQAPPRDASWRALTALLERARPWRDPRRWRELELPYLQRALARWPTPLRRAPSRWLRAVGEGEELPALALATSISVDADLAAWWTTRDGQLSRWHLLQSPWLSGIRALSLRHSELDALFVHQLAHAPHLRALRRLDLSCNRIGPQACGALAGSSLLTRLTHLDLSLNPLGEGVARLADAPQTSLRHLDLSCTGLDDDGAHALAQARGLGGLHTLSLHGNALGHRGWSMLRDSPRVPFDPNTYAAHALAERAPPTLEWGRTLLSYVQRSALTSKYMWAAMCEALETQRVDARWFADLHAYLERTHDPDALHLPRVATPGALARALAGTTPATLEGCDILDLNKLPQAAEHGGHRAMLESILALPELRSLTTIRGMYLPWLDEDSAIALATHAPPSLSSLTLYDCGQLGDRFALALADSARLRELRTLDLSYNDITSLGLHHLRSHARWPRLREVLLRPRGYRLGETASETERALLARAQEVTP
jgi:Leucine-rich repeat (LRR) protein